MSGKWIYTIGAAVAVGLPASVYGHSAPPQTGTDGLVQANTQFGFKLFRELTRTQGGKNVFISPASAAFALDLAYNGAAGATKQAMAHTLELDGMSLADVNRANAALRASLEKPSPHVQIMIANALWANKGITFDPAFRQRAHDFYGADATTLNMHDPSAPKTINGWVSRKTQDKIKNLVNLNDLQSATAVLTDAAYFKGAWKVAFDRAKTAPRPFALTGGQHKTVPMMFQQGRLLYLQDDKVQAINLPYGDGSLSMLVFLPTPRSSLPAFLSSLTTENWARWMGQFRDTKLSGLYLPRFKVEYGASLKPALCALGMAPAFGRGADFTPMGLRGDVIGDVKHKAVMEVNEEGTEAAAATAIVMTRALARDPVMVVDRPFFCAIRDNRTGTILFMGAIEAPE
jgi:serpin B